MFYVHTFLNLTFCVIHSSHPLILFLLLVWIISLCSLCLSHLRSRSCDFSLHWSELILNAQVSLYLPLKWSHVYSAWKKKEVKRKIQAHPLNSTVGSRHIISPYNYSCIILMCIIRLFKLSTVWNGNATICFHENTRFETHLSTITEVTWLCLL